MKFKDLHVGFAKAWTEYEFTHDQVIAKHVEDVTDIQDVNKFLKSLSVDQLTNKETGWRWVARLPLSIDADLAKRGIYKDKAAFNRWKNDPDNAIWALSRDVKTINKGRK
jgi:hypothetical protein